MRINQHRLMAPEGETSVGGSESGGDTATITESVSTTDTANVTNAGTTTTNTATTASAVSNPTAQTATGATESTPKEGEAAYWAEDWRQRLAGSNDKELQQLNRYASPEDIWRKARALEQRLSSGELKANIPKNAGPEELKAWREENGIPETPEKYDLGKDIIIAESDKELVGEFLKTAHETNQTPDQVKASLAAYKNIQTLQLERRNELDHQAKASAEELLRSEWGSEFRRDINLIHGLLDKTGGKELKDKFLNGRLADGTPIGSSPEALKMLLSVALLDNPVGIFVPNAGGNIAQSVDDEIGKIEKMMRNNRAAYNKDEAIQVRYRELLEAREQFKSRK